VTISDIATAKGDQLDPFFIQGIITHPSSSVTTWHHVTQQRPQRLSWELWRRANRLWSDHNNKLYQRLTTWIHPVSKQRRQWPLYANESGVIYATLDTQDEQRYNKWRYSLHKWQADNANDAPKLVIPPSTGVGYCVPKAMIHADSIPISIVTEPNQGTITLNFTQRPIQLQRSYSIEQDRIIQSTQRYTDFRRVGGRVAIERSNDS
jgi:hypothetical protein